MKRIRVTMEILIDCEKCSDLFRAIDHHTEWLIDTDEWPEIISIGNCTVEDLDTQDWAE